MLNFARAQDILNFPDQLTDSIKFRGDVNSFRFTKSGIKSNSQTPNSHSYYFTVPVNPTNESIYIEFKLEMEFNPSSLNYIDLMINDDYGSHKIQIGNKNDGISYSVNNNFISEEPYLFSQNRSTSIFRILIDSTLSIHFQDLNDLNNRTAISEKIKLNNPREIKFEISQSGINAISGHKLNYLKIGSQKWDTNGPEIKGQNQMGNHHLMLTFNEIISTIYPTNFLLDNNPINYFFSSPYNVTLNISQSDFKVFNKKLSIQCADIWGNSCSINLNISLEYLDTPKFGDLLITEIFFDPSPAYGHLPEFEFIEVKNISDKIIDLSSLQWEHNQQFYPFDTGRINSNQVLVFGKSDWQKDWFRKQTKFPNLYANGGQIKLLNSYNQIITQLEYSPDYFREEFKEGGVSLERISISQKDVLNLNSKGGIRGSPGKAELSKTIINDTRICDYFIQRDSLIINWNRNLYSPQVITLINNLDTLRIQFYGDKKTIYIGMQQIELITDSIQVLFIDCDSLSIGQKILPREIDYSRIDFNEIHFETDQYTDFIELVNLGISAVLLEDIDILFYNNQMRLVQVLPLINSKKISIMPGEIIAFCKSPIKLKQAKNYWNQILVPRFTNLSKEGSLVKIQHHIWGTLDELDYNMSQYTHLDNDTHSIEKLDPYLHSNHPNNWRSSIESPTPGAKNSVFNSNVNPDNNFIYSDVTKIILPNDDNIRITCNHDNDIAYVSIDLYTIQGVFLFQLWSLKSIKKSGSYLIPLNSNFKNLPTANYILKFEILYPNNRSNIFKQRISIFNEF